jgi:hypothetical protein
MLLIFCIKRELTLKVSVILEYPAESAVNYFESVYKILSQ